MPKRLLPFIPPSLRVVAVTTEPQHVTVLAVPRSTPLCCPVCRIRSDSVHGSYERHLADLPWQGRSVGLRVRLRRLRFRNPASPAGCRRRARPALAAPPLPAAPSRPRPRRSADRVHRPPPGQPVLRIVRLEPTPAALPPNVIAIDEWARRRGHGYGMIIVDRERKVIADLLPDRDIEAVAAWLRRQPEVEFVNRNRAEVYGESIRQGAPEMVHVLDRWYLLPNLGEGLREALGDEHALE